MNREGYIQNLQNNASEIFEVLDQCSSELLSKKEGAAWSIVEILEHIFLTERLVYVMLLRPSAKEAEQEEVIGQEKLQKLIVNLRARKLKAPDSLEPKGKIKTKEEFIKLFSEQRASLMQDVESDKIKISSASYVHPFLGEMTIRDWLHFIPLHSKRHLEQIKDLLKKKDA